MAKVVPYFIHIVLKNKKYEMKSYRAMGLRIKHKICIFFCKVFKKFCLKFMSIKNYYNRMLNLRQYNIDFYKCFLKNV